MMDHINLDVSHLPRNPLDTRSCSALRKQTLNAQDPNKSNLLVKTMHFISPPSACVEKRPGSEKCHQNKKNGKSCTFLNKRYSSWKASPFCHFVPQERWSQRFIRHLLSPPPVPQISNPVIRKKKNKEKTQNTRITTTHPPSPWP